MGKLTVKKVASLKKPVRHPDGSNLYLQISQAGVKSWLYRYRRDGREHGMGLGPATAISLAEARALAFAARRQLIAGIDPLQARQSTRAAAALARAGKLTFEAAALATIESMKAGWKNPKTEQTWRSMMERLAYPTLGTLDVGQIETPDVLRVLTPIWTEKPVQASRLQQRMARFSITRPLTTRAGASAAIRRAGPGI